MEQPSAQDERKESEKPVLDPNTQRSDDFAERDPRNPADSVNISDRRGESMKNLTQEKGKDTFAPARQDSQRMRQGDIKYSEEKQIQNQIIGLKTRFVRSVYLIVFFQVSVTFFLSYICSDNYEFYKIVNNILIIILSYVVLLGCLMVFFMTNISQVFPYNYLLLLVFTL